MKLTLCFLLLFYFSFTVSADQCESQDTCSKCITNPHCVWCAKADYQGIRCRSSDSDIKKQCPDDLQDMHSAVTVTRNDDFTSSLDNVVQIAPQNMKLNLRVGEPTSFMFKYKQAENYPVDLYFLLDVSKSMSNIRDLLMKQSQDLYNVMRSFTSIIRLGIGTFVDKNTFPFTENQLPLTGNVSLFNETLKNTKFVENFDIPEGGLDALGQVLACSDGTENIIGWSPHSRKIVLFITDDQYHAAGDGIIAGINKPYDGRCYTGTNGIYTKELEMDYPSVAMIKKLAKKIGAIVIFVAKNSVASIYNDLADAVYGKSEEYSVQESESKTKFDKMLKQVYEEKTKTINLITSSTGKIKDFYDIDFNPDCTKREIISYSEPENNCTVKFYEEKIITGTITLKKYISAFKNFSVEVLIDGLNEKLQLDVEVITNCECEATTIQKAPQCNSNGNLECGLCNCDKNWFGPHCNCTRYYDIADDSASCKKKGDDKVCSGNGDCICGACVCHQPGNVQKYSGKFCQCDSDSCPRRNNMICSNHGRCDCGICACDNNWWTGDACDISMLKTNCMKNKKECNDRGKCYNNTCICEVLPEWDERKTNVDSLCVIVPDAGVHKRQCRSLEELVLCIYDGKDSCQNIDGVIIGRTQAISAAEKGSFNICDDVRVGVGCYIYFGYKYHDENSTIELLIEEKANCQETYYMFGGIIFATLILGGICTLVGWKILTTIRDRREYEQFLYSSNQRQSSIRKNVLYTSPKVTINNPAYVENQEQQTNS